MSVSFLYDFALGWLGRIQDDIGGGGGGGSIFIILPHLLYAFGRTYLVKQYRPRSDYTEYGVWSGSATYPAFLHTFTISHVVK